MRFWRTAKTLGCGFAASGGRNVALCRTAERQEFRDRMGKVLFLCLFAPFQPALLPSRVAEGWLRGGAPFLRFLSTLRLIEAGRNAWRVPLRPFPDFVSSRLPASGRFREQLRTSNFQILTPNLCPSVPTADSPIARSGEITRFPTMKTSEIPQLKLLSPAEKLLLVEDLWQEIAAEVEALPLAPHLVQVLEESAARYAVDSREGEPWHDVRARILARRPNG